MADAPVIIDVPKELRDCAADVHTRECLAHHTACSCGLHGRCGDALREAAARIEVALEALAAAIGDPAQADKWARAAHYALTSERKTAFSKG